ncbi:MAG: DUF4339 domain-containing protein, partial [Phycisphaerales bacterium]|nr:DUF4339 domain-containing protein [Phycisphaerales bacterium]
MADFEWYYAENGKAVGPMSRTDLVAKLDRLQRGETLVFGPGLTAWTA